MSKVGECKCVNTEEGADFAIGSIWEMYVAQTVENITNLFSSKIFAAATFKDGLLNVRESSNEISVDFYGVIVTGSTIFEMDMLYSVLRNFSGTDC